MSGLVTDQLATYSDCEKWKENFLLSLTKRSLNFSHSILGVTERMLVAFEVDIVEHFEVCVWTRGALAALLQIFFAPRNFLKKSPGTSTELAREGVPGQLTDYMVGFWDPRRHMESVWGA